MYSFEIDLDEQEIESTTKNKSNINQRLEEVTKNKYAAGTFTKGFFNSEQDECQHNRQTQIHKIEKESNGNKKQESANKRRSKKGLITLEPLKQTKKVEVFENYNKKQEYIQPEIQQLEQVQLQKPLPKTQVPQRAYQTRRMAKKRLSSSQKESQVQKKQTKQQKIQIPKISSPIFFQEEEEQQQITRKQPQSPNQLVQNQRTGYVNEIEQQISIAQNRLVEQVFQESDEDDEVPSMASSDYFDYSALNVFKKQLSSQIKKGSLLRLEMVRDKDGFNTFWPEFHLYFCANSHYVMSAKRTSSKPTSTFIISISKSNYEENSQYYLGKMKSNLLGDMLNVYGPGLNPSNAKDKRQIPRQMVATIVYDSHIFQMGRPRQFQVYVKKQEYRYYSNFPQMKMYEDEIPLNQLYEYAENKQKIKVYRNRKPVWLQQIGGYMLNFKGRVQTASIKNFILQNHQNGPQNMIFGKVNESKFNLDMAHPISPVIAFAVALSSFDSRIMCE